MVVVVVEEALTNIVVMKCKYVVALFMVGGEGTSLHAIFLVILVIYILNGTSHFAWMVICTFCLHDYLIEIIITKLT